MGFPERDSRAGLLAILAMASSISQVLSSFPCLNSRRARVHGKKYRHSFVPIRLVSVCDLELRADRRRKTRLSQNSTCEKNNRCRQPASSRSLAEKKGVRCANHF